MSKDQKRGFGGERKSGGKKFGDRKFGDRKFGDRKPGDRRFGDRKPEDRRFGDRRPDERGPRREGGGWGGPRREQRGESRGYQRADREGGFRGKPGGFRRDPRERDDRRPAPGPSAGAEPQGKPFRPHLGEDELRYHGKNAVMALFKARPHDLIRVYVREEQAAEFKDLLNYCTKERLAYHLVGDDDLERLADSVHHQGVCVVAKARRFLREPDFFRQITGDRTLVLYLDGVGNPHNLGAILRTAAHFGVRFVAVPKEDVDKLSPAIYRTAEGGAEFVSVVRIEDTEKFLDGLEGRGFQLYAFDPTATASSIFDTRLPERCLFVFGAEVEGLSGLVRSAVPAKLSIPGSGVVESLNVSVAAALAMAEFQKQGTQRSVRIVKSKT